VDPNAETSKQTSNASKQQTILLLQTSRHGIDLFASMRRGLSFCENLPCALALQTKRLASVALPQQRTEWEPAVVRHIECQIMAQFAASSAGDDGWLSGGRSCASVCWLRHRFLRSPLLRRVRKRILLARFSGPALAWWSPGLLVRWSAALSAQYGEGHFGVRHTALMPAGLTIISTGIADGPTATGIVSQRSDSNIRVRFGVLSCEC
jgi:hypothetical protein